MFYSFLFYSEIRIVNFTGTLFGLSLILYGTLTNPERGIGGTKDDKDNKNNGKGETTSFPKYLTTGIGSKPHKIKAPVERSSAFTDPGPSEMSARSEGPRTRRCAVLRFYIRIIFRDT